MLLEQLKWPDLAAMAGKTWIAPLAALEQHGRHLPFITDTLIVDAIGRRIEAAAPDRIVLAPVQWLGHSPHHAHFGCVSLNLRPYMDMLRGMCRSLVDMGARRIFLLNGHGGNDAPAKAALCELKNEYRDRRDVQIAYAPYWSLAGEAMSKIRTSPLGGVGHACEMETSIVMAIRPDLVDMSQAADEGAFAKTGYHCLDMLRPQPYYMVRNFHELAASGTLGMPSHASPEKGRQFLDAISDAVLKFVLDFASWPSGE